jgi:TolB-like protein
MTAGTEGPGSGRVSYPNDLSVAVLPSVNLPGDAAQTALSIGIAAEISIELAKVPNLRVVGGNTTVRLGPQISAELLARYRVEVSARREGEQVRITATLRQVDNGMSLWSDSYDRQLADLPAIQVEIATAIANTLRSGTATQR